MSQHNFHPGQAVFSPSFGTTYTIVEVGSVVCTVQASNGYRTVYPTAALRPVES